MCTCMKPFDFIKARNILHTVQCFMFTVQCTLYSVLCSLYCVHCTVYIVQFIVKYMLIDF